MLENAPDGLVAQDRVGGLADRRPHRLLRPGRQPQKHPPRKYEIQISSNGLARRSGQCVPSDMIKDAPNGLVAQDRASRQAGRQAASSPATAEPSASKTSFP
jgi:hypothetical protein